MRSLKRALSIAGWLLLGVAAVAGLVLSVAFVALTTDLGRVLLVRPALSFIQGQIAGRIQVSGLKVLPRGAIEIEGVEVFDPEGERVLRLEGAVLKADVSGLSARTVGLRAEAHGLSLVLRRDPGGGFSIARALAPARPSREEAAPGGRFDWTVRLQRLEIDGADVRVVEPGGETSVAAGDLRLWSRGRWGPRSGGLELSLRGALTAPASAPLSLDLVASLRRSTFRLPLLKASLGRTSLDTVAEGDLAARSGRAAVLAFGANGGELAKLVPRLPLAGEVGATAYAESDGAVATAALEARSHQDGSASAAVAARVSGPAAAGFEVRVEGLDPSRLATVAPRGDLHLQARGMVAGKDLDTLRGALALSVGPSTLRSGRFGPAEVRATARDGAIEVSRLSAELPGATLDGRGSWRAKGAIEGRLSAASGDLSLLSRNLAALAGTPAPRLAGSFRLDAEVSGTARAPGARIELSAPRLAAGGLEMREVVLGGRLEDRAVEASASALLPDVGTDPFALQLSGRLADDLSSLGLSDLSLAWPGSRFALAAPARLGFAGPALDRLELRSGSESIAVAGGLKGKELDARLDVEGFDLSRLPAKLLPPGLGLGGRITLAVEARGRPASPVVGVEGRWAEGTAAGLSGLEADLRLRLDGLEGRATASLAARGAGGEATLRADVPADPRRAPAKAPIAFSLAVRGLSLADAVRASGRDLPLSGRAGVEMGLEGTMGEPSLSAALALSDVRYGPHGPFAVRLRLEDPGERARLAAEADDAAQRVLEAEAAMPLRLAELLRHTEAAVRALQKTPFEARATVRDLDLSRQAGKGAVPAELAGRVEGRAELSGTPAAPRGRFRIAVAGGALAGFSEMDGSVELSARDAATELSGRVALSRAEALRLHASLGLPAERLADRHRAEAAPLRVDVEVPPLQLSRVRGPVALAGTAEGKLTVGGSAAAPEVSLRIGARQLSVESRSIGDVTASAQAGPRGLSAEAGLQVATGGAVRASLRADAPVTLAAVRGGDLTAAPARARLVADAVDLHVLPALAPGVVRTASGRLDAALDLAGPLSRLEPRGTLRLSRGALATGEYGEWTGIEVEATVDEGGVRVPRLEAQRNRGHLFARVETRGLPRAGKPVELSGTLRLQSLAIPRGGQNVATVDLESSIAGTAGVDETRAEVTVAQARVQLPKSLSRNVQSLDPHKDVVIGKPVAAGPGRPYRVVVHVVIPSRFLVTSDLPKMDLELKADTTTTWQTGGQFTAEGRVETVKGKVEPIPGRTFEIQRGIVRFTGADPESAQIDAVARYENPSAKVNVTVGGTAAAPQTKMTSEPPMDEAQIAMLLATGRTDFKAGGGAVSSLTGQDVGAAALGLVATQFLRDVVADKLPLDAVAIDSSQLRAGVYLSERVYVGYVRRFSAKLEAGENANEARLEYQISRSWTFEASGGDAGSGEANVMWSKDY
jgi:translocation and assembly module TamB